MRMLWNANLAQNHMELLEAMLTALGENKTCLQLITFLQNKLGLVQVIDDISLSSKVNVCTNKTNNYTIRDTKPSSKFLKKTVGLNYHCKSFFRCPEIALGAESIILFNFWPNKAHIISDFLFLLCRQAFTRVFTVPINKKKDWMI